MAYVSAGRIRDAIQNTSDYSVAVFEVGDFAKLQAQFRNEVEQKDEKLDAVYFSAWADRSDIGVIYTWPSHCSPRNCTRLRVCHLFEFLRCEFKLSFTTELLLLSFQERITIELTEEKRAIVASFQALTAEHLNVSKRERNKRRKGHPVLQRICSADLFLPGCIRCM